MKPTPLFETVNVDKLVIDKAAQQAYLLDQYRRPLIPAAKLRKGSIKDCLSFTFPFAYIDSKGRYSIFANWHCLPEIGTSAQTIQLCVFEKSPANVQHVAWSYFWKHLAQSAHPDQAIRFVFEAIEQCPEDIRAKLLDTGMKHEVKSITSALCEVGIQRSKSIAKEKQSLAFSAIRGSGDIPSAKDIIAVSPCLSSPAEGYQIS
jgi:hypothetical protein